MYRSKRPIYCAVMAMFLMLISLSVRDASAITINIIQNNWVEDNSFRLVSSSPADGAAVSSPPASVSLTFSQAPKADKSSIRVLDMFGMRREEGTAQVQDATLSIPIQELPPGRYTIKWRARCNCDADRELSDSLRFTVQPQ